MPSMKKQTRGGVLLVVGEILNDSIFILSCWHKQVSRLEVWLGVVVVRYRLYHCRALNQIVSFMKHPQLTSCWGGVARAEEPSRGNCGGGIRSAACLMESETRPC